ncbi:hypothetical protein PENSPDRAFT_647059 [Peniophora sp. CONT]|nr:hypothetical protein PENSPDRAFT_647059 [Peniophora sp. CONT]
MALFSKAAVAHYILESQITSDNEASVARNPKHLRWQHEKAYSHLALFRRIQELECHRLASPDALGNTPIHSLPVELLSYVFTLLIPDAAPFSTAAQEADPTRAICSVSRLWRDTAQNHTPTL